MTTQAGVRRKGNGAFARAGLARRPAFQGGCIGRPDDYFADTPHVTGDNRQYLCPGPIASKCAGRPRDFVGYVKAADPGLLNTVFGWSLANEVFVNTTEGSFVRTKGEAVRPTPWTARHRGRPVTMRLSAIGQILSRVPFEKSIPRRW